MPAMTRRLRIPLFVALPVALAACSDSSDRSPEPPPIEPPEPEYTYEAEIIWTEYGIPHVLAEDWGSLGYGSGYSYAQENFCVAMKEFVRANGETARYFGDEGDLDSDLVYKLYNSDEAIQRMLDTQPEYIIAMWEGYVAGINRYLDETGVDNLAEGEEGCRGADWVREIELGDAVRLAHKFTLSASADQLTTFIAAARPGDALVQRLPNTEAEQLLAQIDRTAVAGALDLAQGAEIGSNAYAVGEQESQTNAGILFGNPHFPWQGYRRFHMLHLTMGDEYNIMGATLHGLPMVGIGFNDSVAWSHTVSTGTRFTLYELELNPENSLEYIYDGETREFDTQTVSAERVGDDGTVETIEHTFYFSHYGPVVDLGSISPLLGGWPNAIGTLLTYRDANLENMRTFDQLVRMGQASNLDEFKESLRTVALPFFNTIAADRDGNAFYGDISVKPHVTINQYDSCIRGPLQNQLTDFGIVTMDGTDPDCEWGEDEGTAEGIFGYDNLPKLETREYAGNANDSYWLPNPRYLLEGFSPVMGRERVQQTMRTRHTFDMAERRLAGSDDFGQPKFNIDNIREISYQATNYVAELLLRDLVAICSETRDWTPYSANPAVAEEACTVLADWDGRHQLDSVGGHIFWEFWQRARDIENLWSVPFDPAQPVGTPTSLSLDSAVLEDVRLAFGAGVDRLQEAGIPMDLPWGELQFVEKNGEPIGIHGGPGAMMFSVITSNLVDGEGYSNITHGNSYIQAVTWDESDCPDAYAILTYSQSTDPASDHYADATELYSEGGWIDMPYCEADRDLQELRRETIAE